MQRFSERPPKSLQTGVGNESPTNHNTQSANPTAETRGPDTSGVVSISTFTDCEDTESSDQTLIKAKLAHFPHSSSLLLPPQSLYLKSSGEEHSSGDLDDVSVNENTSHGANIDIFSETELGITRSEQNFTLASLRTSQRATDEKSELSLRVTADEEVPYTLLKKGEKVGVVVLISFIAMLSLILAPIFFPIIPVMRHKFHTSNELLNMAVVVYLLFQGFSPTIMSNLADRFGRRPIVVLCLLIYMGANLGLLLLNAYWLILFFRCLQSGGIAPVVSISSGIVGDFTQRKERGSYVGAVQGITLVGQGFGALIGLALASSKFGWRAIFWFLLILSSVTCIILLVILPETKRSIVGNLSVRAPHWVNRAPITYLPFFQQRTRLNQVRSLLPSSKKVDVLALFKIMILPEVACALLPASFVFSTWTMALTSYTTILTDSYHYKTMHVGLLYLPMGLGLLTGSMVCGRILDYIYKWEQKKYQLKFAGVEGAPKFNLFKARLQMFVIPSFSMTASTIVFAWTLEKKAGLGFVIVSSFVMSFVAIFPVTMCTTILIDIFPTTTSTATSLVNFSRCTLSLVGVAVLSKMEKAMSVGGCYTFMAGLCLVGNVFIYLVILKGRQWSERRENTT